MKFKFLYFVFVILIAVSSVASARKHHKHRCHHGKTTHTTVYHDVHHYYPRHRYIYHEPAPVFVQPAPVYYINPRPWRPYVIREYVEPITYVEPVWPSPEFNLFFSF